MAQTGTHTANHRPGQIVGQTVGVRLQQGGQLAALQQLHRDVRHVAVFVEIEDRHDVAVPERLRFGGFALERDKRLRMGAEVVVQHLDRKVRLAVASLDLAQVLGAEHGAHATRPELLLQHKSLLENFRGPVFVNRRQRAAWASL